MHFRSSPAKTARRTGAASLFLLIFLAAPPAGAAPATGQARMAIARGSVVDQTGTPIEGVAVIMQLYLSGTRLHSMTRTMEGSTVSQVAEADAKKSSYDIETKEDGTFSHPGLRPNVYYRVRFEKDGYIPREEKLAFRVAANDIGTFVLVNGDVEAARQAYEKGYGAYSIGDLTGAIGPMEEVAEVYGDSDSSDEMLVVALGVLGQGYMQTGRPEEARVALERLLAIKPDSAIALRGIGQLQAMQGDVESAYEYFLASVELEPDNPTGQFFLGYALQSLGKPAEAIPHLEACIAAQPGFVQARKAAGMAYTATGNKEKAIEHLEAYLQAAAGAPDAAEVRAQIDKLKGG